MNIYSIKLATDIGLPPLWMKKYPEINEKLVRPWTASMRDLDFFT